MMFHRIPLCNFYEEEFQTMIQLKSVSVDNWYACTQLNVTEEQKKVFPRRLYIGLLNPK